MGRAARDRDRQPTNAESRLAATAGREACPNHPVSDLQQPLRAISAPIYGQSGRRCDSARLSGAHGAIRNSAKNSPISGRFGFGTEGVFRRIVKTDIFGDLFVCLGADLAVAIVARSAVGTTRRCNNFWIFIPLNHYFSTLTLLLATDNNRDNYSIADIYRRGQ